MLEIYRKFFKNLMSLSATGEYWSWSVIYFHTQSPIFVVTIPLVFSIANLMGANGSCLPNFSLSNGLKILHFEYKVGVRVVLITFDKSFTNLVPEVTHLSLLLPISFQEDKMYQLEFRKRESTGAQDSNLSLSFHLRLKEDCIQLEDVHQASSWLHEHQITWPGPVAQSCQSRDP